MIVLKIIGWVLLGILALIVLALFVRVGVEAEYSDKKTSAVITWLFLKIPLYPTKKKEKQEEKTDGESPDAKKNEEEPKQEDRQEEEPENTEETPEENSEKAETSEGLPDESEKQPVSKKKKKESFIHLLYRTNGIDGILLLLKRLLSYTGTFLGNLIRGVVVDEFDLRMSCVKKGDAAATAIYYGEVCSALFPMLGALASKCRMKKHSINVYPDYLARYSDACFFIKLHITPMYLIGITVAYVIKLVFKVVLRMFVKIFMPDKNNKAGNSDITKNKEKSGKTV